MEEPVEEGDEGAVWGCVIYGRAYDKRIGFLEFFGCLVYRIVENTASVFLAVAAGDTARDRLRANLHYLNADALTLKLACKLGECAIGCAVLVGTAVDQ